MVILDHRLRKNSLAGVNIAKMLWSPDQNDFAAGKETRKSEEPGYTGLWEHWAVSGFEESENKTFALNDLGAALQTDAPGTAKDFILAILVTFSWLWRSYLWRSDRGKVPFQHIHGMDLWEYKQYPEAGEKILEEGWPEWRNGAKGIMENYDFSPCKIVDMGGSNGVWYIPFWRCLSW